MYSHQGDNIKLKCISQNQRGNDQIGYSWTRDNLLFPMIPGKEYWEDLKPAGTILRVYNIQVCTRICISKSEFKLIILI